MTLLVGKKSEVWQKKTRRGLTKSVFHFAIKGPFDQRVVTSPDNISMESVKKSSGCLG